MTVPPSPQLRLTRNDMPNQAGQFPRMMCPRCHGLMHQGDAYEDTKCYSCGHRPAPSPLAYTGNREIEPGGQPTTRPARSAKAGVRRAEYVRLKKALLAMSKRGISGREAARELGISARTAHRWLAKP